MAILSATSYARLSIAYPQDRGGTVAFLNESFGSGIFVGGLNVLLWLSYVVMISLYAAAFAQVMRTVFSRVPRLAWSTISSSAASSS